MEIEDIKRRIFALRDEEYAAFTSKLIPGMSEGYIIGVRTPALRLLAKEIVRAGGEEPFLNRLPHDSFEENLLHAFILGIKKMTLRDFRNTPMPYIPFCKSAWVATIFTPAASALSMPCAFSLTRSSAPQCSTMYLRPLPGTIMCVWPLHGILQRRSPNSGTLLFPTSLRADLTRLCFA